MNYSKYIYPLIDDSLLKEINNVETPAIIYDGNAIIKIVNNIKKDLKTCNLVKLHYSMKACRNKKILKLINSQDVGIDVSSINEFRLAKDIGFRDISITSCNLKSNDLHEIYKEDVIIDFDSIEQLIHFGEKFPNSSIGLRLRYPQNDYISSYTRFGVNIEDELLWKNIKKYNFSLYSIHIHFNVESCSDLLNALKYILSKSYLFPNLKIINLGGGLEKLYINNRKDFILFLVEMKVLLEKGALNIEKIIFEPGSAIMSKVGYLITSVLSVKRFPNYNIAILDSSAWNIAPWYLASVCNYPYEKEMLDENYYLSGCSMFGNDFFSNSDKKITPFKLSKLEEGSKLLFNSFGSYTSVNYRRLNYLADPSELVFYNGEWI